MNVYKITKYENGSSKSNEWTDLFSFFELNQDGVKNIDEYLKIENQYIEYINNFLQSVPYKSLKLGKYIDFRDDDWAIKYLFTDYEKEISIQNDDYSLNEILTICRLMLRGVIVSRFKGDDCLLYISENMYVYVGSILAEFKSLSWAPESGKLFIKSYPYDWL